MHRKILAPILTSVLMVGCHSAQPPELSVFRFDGCSCFPEGTLKKSDLWEEDCLRHDYAYWQGGTRKERKQADRKLREGIRSKGQPISAQLAYIGVRIGGSPWLPTPWRWGFGWNEFPRGYRTVGKEERQQIERLSISPISIADETRREPDFGEGLAR